VITVKTRPFVCWIVFIAALAGLLFGFDISVIAGAMEFIQEDFHATDQILEFPLLRE